MENPLKKKMEEEGLNVDDVKRELNVSRVTVWNWMNDLHTPSRGQYSQLADFLDMREIRVKKIFHALNERSSTSQEEGEKDE